MNHTWVDSNSIEVIGMILFIIVEIVQNGFINALIEVIAIRFLQIKIHIQVDKNKDMTITTTI